MFKKVIIAEDINSINIGVQQTLAELAISDIDHSRYCDEALLKIRKAIAENAPFDLLITDLSFKEDHHTATITSGKKLVNIVKDIQPEIKIIVLSIEDRAYRIKTLFEDGIDAYIKKDRNDMQELKQAMRHIASTGERFVPAEMAHIIADDSLEDIKHYDTQLLKQLASGLSPDEIAIHFRNTQVKPNSTSSIEKRISHLRTFFNASNNAQLIFITNELGLVCP
jgi:two-component system capsular synthesis response regulator RcsB